MGDIPGAEEVLAQAELLAPRPLRGVDNTLRAEGLVEVIRPFVYPIAGTELPTPLQARAATLATRYVGVLFAADLLELPRGRTYARVEFRVRLADPAVRAVGLDSDARVLELADALGAVLPAPTPTEMQRLGAARPARFRLLGRAEPGERLRTTGLLGSSFSWAVAGAGPALAAGGSLVRHATLELPPGSAGLAGHIVVETTIVRTGGRFRQDVTATSREVPFSEPLPGDRVALDGGHPVRLIISADVKSYSSNDVRAAERLQASLVQVMGVAREATGVVGVEPQPQGDCLTFAFPPASDDLRVLPTFLAALTEAVGELNKAVPDDDVLRLRVGAARGVTGTSAAGWSGQAVIAATRLRDSEPARHAMTAADAALVVTVSDELYADVLAREPGPGPAFQKVVVQDPAKDFEATAWCQVAG